LKRSLVTLLALGLSARAAAAPPIELSGCSDDIDPIALERALSLEVQGELVGDYQLDASFTCEGETSGVELRAREASGRELHAALELGAVPVDARPRLLAIVWGELLVALAGETVRTEPPPESTTFVFGKTGSFEARPAPPPRALAIDAPPLPSLALPASDAPPMATPPRKERRARRPGLLSRGTDEAGLFDVSAAFSTVSYWSGWDVLLGATLAVRLDALRALAFYRQHPGERTTLGGIEARIWGVGLELSVWCHAARAVQTCALTSFEVGRGQVSGQAVSGVSEAQALDVLFLSGALGATSRLGGDWLALELGLLAGFARGPTATVGGESQVTMNGGFVSLSLGAVVQP
jgi:hypothetical protein